MSPFKNHRCPLLWLAYARGLSHAEIKKTSSWGPTVPSLVTATSDSAHQWFVPLSLGSVSTNVSQQHASVELPIG